MICTVSVTVGPDWAWQSGLLERSWRRARQPGRLAHLRAVNGAVTSPAESEGVFYTTSWCHHPYQHDEYPSYDLPAALLEWSLAATESETVLVLSPDSVLRAPIDQEVEEGSPIAQPWPELELDPTRPLGLGPELAGILPFCADPELRVQAVRTPLLIHAADLRRLAARWLELTGLLRRRLPPDLREASVALAYPIAAAERGLVHNQRHLEADVGDNTSGAPIVRYADSVRDSQGRSLFSQRTYVPWRPVADPSHAVTENGRYMLEVLGDLAARHSQSFEQVRPRRREEALEGRVGGRLLVFAPGETQGHSLDGVQRRVWELCDGERDVGRILADLERLDPRGACALDQVRDHLLSFERSGILELG